MAEKKVAPSVTSRTRLLVLLVSAPIIAFAIVGGFLGQAMAQQSAYGPLQVFNDVVQLVSRNYVEKVDSDRIMHGAMRGLAEALDPDSAYLGQDDVKAYEDRSEPAGDVGIELTRQYYLRVIAARDGSPAARAGLRSGDFVRIIDDRPTREMSVFDGMRMLRGKPGTKVKLTIIRGSLADPHVVELTREALPPPAVAARLLENGVGYLRIPGFSATTAEHARARIGELRTKGASRLIVDVRDCASGEMDNGVSLARLFVRSGTLAYMQTRDETRQAIAASSGDGSIQMPVVVLVNGGTAGPAEVFAAALNGNKRASLVGEQTLGRASLQKLIQLPDGTGMLISHSWFLTPSGDQIQDKGLTPEVEVNEPDVEFGAEPPATDPTLQKALEQLRTKAAA
jgi:carboxyl-terminal processing protease